MNYVKPMDIPLADSSAFMSAAEIVKLANKNRNVQSLDAAANWIPVASRVPDQSGDYLVLLRGERHKLMSYDKRENSFEPKSMSRVVTHWMSLPPAPGQSR